MCVSVHGCIVCLRISQAPRHVSIRDEPNSNSRQTCRKKKKNTHLPCSWVSKCALCTCEQIKKKKTKPAGIHLMSCLQSLLLQLRGQISFKQKEETKFKDHSFALSAVIYLYKIRSVDELRNMWMILQTLMHDVQGELNKAFGFISPSCKSIELSSNFPAPCLSQSPRHSAHAAFLYALQQVMNYNVLF